VDAGLSYYMLEMPSDSTKKCWFDGYTGEPVLIIDEFSDYLIRAVYMRRLLDVYRLQVEVKGGFVYALWNLVVITTNVKPWEWYASGGSDNGRGPVLRRGTEIRRFYKEGREGVTSVYLVSQRVDMKTGIVYDFGDVNFVYTIGSEHRVSCLDEDKSDATTSTNASVDTAKTLTNTNGFVDWRSITK